MDAETASCKFYPVNNGTRSLLKNCNSIDSSINSASEKYIHIVHYRFVCDYINPVWHICPNLLKTGMEKLIASDKNAGASH